RPFVTEGLRPGLVACSHHLGRWHRVGEEKTARFASAPVELSVEGDLWRWRRAGDLGGGGPHWWRESGVHQNITFPVHPDPISGMHCWHQRVRLRRAPDGDRFGDVVVDRARARAVWEEWRALTRPAAGELRRPLWLARAVRPADAAYRRR
ncbi:MAG: formate dehydrogenase, partial [Planctomycetota bacterium]